MYTVQTLCNLKCSIPLSEFFEIKFKFFFINPLVKQSWYNILLWDGQSGDHILMGSRFSTPIQTDHGTHPASYTNETRSFPVVKLSRVNFTFT